MSIDDSARIFRRFTPVLGPLEGPPLSVGTQVEFGAWSRRGSRSVNQDHYLITRLGRTQETLMTSLPESDAPGHFDESAFGMIVADGIGSEGEAASRLAMTILSHLVIHFGKWNLRINADIAQDVMDNMERFYRGVDSALAQASGQSSNTLRTTLTAAISTGNQLFFAHVGHSRVYLLRGGELLQLTQDHSLGARGARKPAIADIVTSARDLHHILTDTLGAGGRNPRIDIEHCALQDGDRLLLCTNGLTDVVEDEMLAETLNRPGTPDGHCEALMNLAAERGAVDDATAVVAHYRIAG